VTEDERNALLALVEVRCDFGRLARAIVPREDLEDPVVADEPTVAEDMRGDAEAVPERRDDERSSANESVLHGASGASPGTLSRIKAGDGGAPAKALARIKPRGAT
jgi:hypothetical protein